MLIARAPKVSFNVRATVPRSRAVPFKSASRTSLLSRTNPHLVSLTQIKHKSSLGFDSILANNLKQKWGVIEDKKQKDGVLHACPVQLLGESGKLAGAMYSALVDKLGDDPKVLCPVVENIDRDLQKIVLATQAYPEYAEIFMFPTKNLPAKSSHNLMMLLKGIKPCLETALLVHHLLFDLGCLDLLIPTAKDWHKIAQVLRGEVELTLTTAQQLSAEERKQWENKLSLILLPGEKLVLHTKVDPTLLSGYVVDGETFRHRHTGVDEYKKFRDSFQKAWNSYEVALKAREDPKFSWSAFEKAQRHVGKLLGKPDLQLINEPAPFSRPKTDKELMESLNKNGATVANLLALGVKVI